MPAGSRCGLRRCALPALHRRPQPGPDTGTGASGTATTDPNRPIPVSAPWRAVEEDKDRCRLLVYYRYPRLVQGPMQTIVAPASAFLARRLSAAPGGEDSGWIGSGQWGERSGKPGRTRKPPRGPAVPSPRGRPRVRRGRRRPSPPARHPRRSTSSRPRARPRATRGASRGRTGRPGPLLCPCPRARRAPRIDLLPDPSRPEASGGFPLGQAFSGSDPPRGRPPPQSRSMFSDE